MTSRRNPSIRFSLLTALIWLAVAAGIIFLLWNAILRLSGKDLPISTPTPGHTQVYQTIAAMLTGQASTSTPAAERTNTPLPTPETTRLPTASATVALSTRAPASLSQTSTPVMLCDRASAGNPIDVSIPDNSSFSPGESFVKTWKLVNSGTCTWTTQYSTNFFYGDQMDAPEFIPFKSEVLPDQTIEISIEMVAPSSPGTYQGNWMLSNSSGDLFGIGPNNDAPFWVRIIVEAEATSTPAPTMEFTPTFTPTETITVTATLESNVKGKLNISMGESVDADTLALNGQGADLAYQVDTEGYHWLVTHADAAIGFFGSQEPQQADCQSTEMSPNNLVVEALAPGTYLCYTTDEGRLGRVQLVAADPDSFALTLDFLTWARP